MRSAIILAGGKSRRFRGSFKCIHFLKNKPLLKYVLETVENSVDEVITVAKDSFHAKKLDFLTGKIAVDKVKNFGPVAGIHAGLLNVESEKCLVISCDTPFINEKAIKFLFKECSGFEGSVPANGGLEPLTAVYKRKPMVKASKKALKKGNKRIVELFADLRSVNFVSKEEITPKTSVIDPFFNINTFEDLVEAENKMEEMEEKICL